jgi:hypothetical protein
VSVVLYAIWEDKDYAPTILEKVFIVGFIISSWYTITAVFILTILNIIGHIFLKDCKEV